MVVRNQTVLAVEAIEGTDEAIRRGGNLCREKAVVMQKRLAAKHSITCAATEATGRYVIKSGHQAMSMSPRSKHRVLVSTLLMSRSRLHRLTRAIVERLAVVDSHQNIIHDYEALLQMSRDKTARLRKEIGAPEFKMEDL